MNPYHVKLGFVAWVYKLIVERSEPTGDFTKLDIIGYALSVPPAFIPEHTGKAACMFVDWMYSCSIMPTEPMLPDWFHAEQYGY